jgi:hypothetical protein
MCKTVRALLNGVMGGPMPPQVFMGVGCLEFFLVPVALKHKWDPTEQ